VRRLMDAGVQPAHISILAQNLELREQVQGYSPPAPPARVWRDSRQQGSSSTHRSAQRRLAPRRACESGLGQRIDSRVTSSVETYDACASHLVLVWPTPEVAGVFLSGGHAHGCGGSSHVPDSPKQGLSSRPRVRLLATGRSHTAVVIADLEAVQDVVLDLSDARRGPRQPLGLLPLSP
jgi:hypothetical protein